MIRTVIGGLVAGVIIFVMGFIFWATPLGALAFKTAGDPESAALQTALAQNLTRTGTGTYEIPYAGTPQGQTLYGRGPIATIHFNTAGASKEDMGMLLPGFIVAIASGLLIAFGLSAVGGHSFGALARLVMCFSLGFTVWKYLGAPIFNHYGWGYWIYAFVAESIALIAAGLVVARWFVRHPEAPVAQPARAE